MRYSWDSGSHTPTTRDCHCWDKSPFTASGSSDTLGPCLRPCSPHSLTRGDSQGRASDVHSTEQFIHSAVTQKQPQLLPPSKIPRKESLGFHALAVQVSSSLTFSPESSTPAVSPSIHSPGWQYRPSCPLLFKCWQFTVLLSRGWPAADFTVFVVQMISSSRLLSELPLRAKSASQPASCKPSYLHQMHSSTHLSKVLWFCGSRHLRISWCHINQDR